jgi:hypothetical protein
MTRGEVLLAPLLQSPASAPAVKNLGRIRSVLKQMTGRDVRVKPVVLFPGWWVQSSLHRAEVYVANPKRFLQSFKPVREYPASSSDEARSSFCQQVWSDTFGNASPRPLPLALCCLRISRRAARPGRQPRRPVRAAPVPESAQEEQAPLAIPTPRPTICPSGSCQMPPPASIPLPPGISAFKSLMIVKRWWAADLP